MGDLPTHTHSGLFSRATCPHILTLVYFHGRPTHTLPIVYFHGRPAHTLGLPEIPSGDLIQLERKYCVTRLTWNPIWRFPLTKAIWDPIWRPHSTGTKLCVTRLTWNPIWRFPLTKATWDPIWRPHSTKTKECVKNGLIVWVTNPRKMMMVSLYGWRTPEKWWSHCMGDEPQKNDENMKWGLIVMGDLPWWKKYDEMRSHYHGWPTRKWKKYEVWSHCNGWPTQMERIWKSGLVVMGDLPK